MVEETVEGANEERRERWDGGGGSAWLSEGPEDMMGRPRCKIVRVWMA